MTSRATIAAGIWAECKEDEYSSHLLKEWEILQYEVTPNPFVVCYSGFLGLGKVQHLDNRARYKGFQHHGQNFSERQCHSHSQIETARWPWRREVVLISELGVRPGGVLPAEGATHTIASSFGAHQKESCVLKVRASSPSNVSSNPWCRWLGNRGQEHALMCFSR